jgi:uncharacterized protein (TIGR02147 family)
MIYGAQTSREAISSEIRRRQRDNPLYSMNAFARQGGISLPYLSLILSGKRPITIKVADRLAMAAGMGSAEREFFRLLVKRDGATDPETSELLAKKIADLRKKNAGGGEDLLAFDVIADWHHSAILEAINLEGLSHTAKAIADKLGLDAPTVSKALAKLQNLGLIQRKGQKYVRVDSGFLNTTSEVKNLALRNFHRQALRLGLAALDHDALEDRSCTGITMAIDPAKIPEAKRRILAFQKELMEFLEDGPRKEVYQLETVLFRMKKYKGLE